jgi:hypothetical protein
MRVITSGFFFGQTCQNVLHFNNPDGLTTPADIATDIKNNWLVQISAMSSGNIVWNNISVRRVDGGTEAPYNLAVSIAGAQSGSAQQLTFLAYVIRIRTAVVGRRGRGRIYVPGPNLNLTNLGVWASSTITGWQTPLNNLAARYLAGGTSSIRLGVASHTDPSDWKAATQLLLASIPGIQRRRNIGVGV